jgi:hypothetical protein
MRCVDEARRLCAEGSVGQPCSEADLLDVRIARAAVNELLTTWKADVPNSLLQLLTRPVGDLESDGAPREGLVTSLERLRQHFELEVELRRASDKVHTL